MIAVLIREWAERDEVGVRGRSLSWVEVDEILILDRGQNCNGAIYVEPGTVRWGKMWMNGTKEITRQSGAWWNMI